MVMLKDTNSPLSVNFSKVSFLVYIIDAPFYWYSEAIGHLIGQKIGIIIVMDLTGPSLRIPVLLKISKALGKYEPNLVPLTGPPTIDKGPT